MAEVTRQGSSATVLIGEDVVASMAEDLRTELRDLVEGGVTELTLDLIQTDMLDSIGMGLLISAHNSVRDGGGGLRLVNVSPDIAGLLRSMRLENHFIIEERRDG